MIQGFAAHLIEINGTNYKNMIVMINGENRFVELRSLDRETPFTRFFDGMLKVVRRNDEAVGCGEEINHEDVVSIWQYNPYDLFGEKELPETRRIRVL